MKPAAFLLSCALLGTVEAKELRIATFNASLFRPGAGELIADTAKKDQEQLLAVAAIIRKIDADVLLLNEFDYDEKEQALGNFQTNYLHDLYPHHFSAPVNTGVPSGMDLNHDGDTTDPQDAFGYGTHPGQYGMVLFSKFPLQTDSIRTFQKLLWRDLPGNMIPKSYYTAGQVDKLRLSSKSHWDVPITVENQTVHVLCSHPTPPTFDDGRLVNLSDTSPVDWNGRRNHDEIRFWAEYISHADARWIVDDKVHTGGLAAGSRFVVLGDLNADPDDGDTVAGAVRQLLEHPLVNASIVPTSKGALANVPPSYKNRESKTSHFHLRCDYVLPSRQGFEVTSGAVHWPENDASLDKASDHRAVWMEMKIKP